MKPLAGVRVLELAHLFPGPYMAALLGDLGADVVKVEPPGGDAARHMPPIVPETGQGFAFGAANRGKRSIILDLKDAGARRTFLALAARADVVVQGYRPGVAERLGVDAAACLAANPRLVYVHMTGWGPEGPWRDRPGHDITYQALAGCLLPGPDAQAPVTPTADVLGAMWGACLAAAALVEARRTGTGRLVEVGLSGAALVASTLTRALEGAGVDLASAPHPLVGGLPGYDVHRCRDGRFIAIGILEPEWWSACCAALGDPALESLGVPTTHDEARAARARVAAAMGRRDRADWLVALREAGVPFAPVLSASEAVESGAAGGARVPPHLASRDEAFDVPRLGAHMDEVLKEWLGA